MVLVLNAHIDTLILHLSEVNPLLFVETYDRRCALTLDEDTATMIREVVYLEREVAKKGQLDTGIELERFLPLHEAVSDFTGSDASHSLRSSTECESRCIGVNGGVICETSRTTDLVVTDLTVRNFELEKVDSLFDRLPERFVAYHITYCDRREETETLAGGEVLGTVVTEVEFSEVAVLI